MKTLGRIVLINLLIYGAYMSLLAATDTVIVGAPLILIHSVGLFIMSALNRTKRPEALEERTEANIEIYSQQRQKRQGYLISGLLILIIGMPVCFVVGASGFKVQ